MKTKAISKLLSKCIKTEIFMNQISPSKPPKAKRPKKADSAEKKGLTRIVQIYIDKSSPKKALKLSSTP